MKFIGGAGRATTAGRVSVVGRIRFGAAEVCKASVRNGASMDLQPRIGSLDSE